MKQLIVLFVLTALLGCGNEGASDADGKDIGGGWKKIGHASNGVSSGSVYWKENTENGDRVYIGLGSSGTVSITVVPAQKSVKSDK